MRPEITLTEEERGKLVAAVHAERGWDSFAHHLNGAEIGHLVRLALSAVPRLALAAPVVGELVATARDYDLWVGDYLSQGGLWNPEMADHAAVRDALIHFRDRFRAALTGGEGRDG